MRPSRDPNSTKYPDRVWYNSRWLTKEQVVRRRIENLRSVYRYQGTTKGIINDWNSKTNRILDRGV